MKRNLLAVITTDYYNGFFQILQLYEIDVHFAGCG